MTATISLSISFGGSSTFVQEPMLLSKVLLEETIVHQAIENSPFVLRLRSPSATKEEYMQYLVNIFWGIQTLEEALEKAQRDPVIESFDFKRLYRRNALSQDIQHIDAKLCLPFDQVHQHDFTGYIRRLLLRDPHLLLAHAAVRYLPILFGGQPYVKHLETLWDGKTPTNLYSFSEDVVMLRTDFLKKIDVFGKSLNQRQYREFLDEIQTAWEFAGDIVGVDVRNLSRTRALRAAL